MKNKTPKKKINDYLTIVLTSGIFIWLPDKIYLKILYKLIKGCKLDLESPKTFNEKLQWLKLYDRNQKYTEYVDKYEVRKYIKTKIGKEYLIPLLAVYEKFNDINFDDLPNRFVLKCTHDSGRVVICKDKTKLDIKKASNMICKSLKKNYYYNGREWPYKNVKPRIVCEKLLEDNIKDYKFYCFNGIPKFLYVSQGLVYDHSLKVNFYDMNWNKVQFKRNDYNNFDLSLDPPTMFEKMKEICKKLSQDIPFVRVDLYQVKEKIYFSELTFTPTSGFMPIEPEEYNLIIGDMLQLPLKNKSNINI